MMICVDESTMHATTVWTKKVLRSSRVTIMSSIWPAYLSEQCVAVFSVEINDATARQKTLFHLGKFKREVLRG